MLNDVFKNSPTQTPQTSLIYENIIHTPNKSADFSDSADYEGVVALLP